MVGKSRIDSFSGGGRDLELLARHERLRADHGEQFSSALVECRLYGNILVLQGAAR